MDDDEEPHFLEGEERRRFLEEHNLPPDAFVVPWKVAVEMAEPFPRCDRVIDANMSQFTYTEGYEEGFVCGRRAGHFWPCLPEPTPLDLMGGP